MGRFFTACSKGNSAGETAGPGGQRRDDKTETETDTRLVTGSSRLGNLRNVSSRRVQNVPFNPVPNAALAVSKSHILAPRLLQD